MLEKPTHQMNFVWPSDPIPTVEVDLDDLPDDCSGYGSILARALDKAVKKNADLVATIYVYHTPSINFGRQTSSAFFGVAGPRSLLYVLRSAFEGAGVENVRFSDYITTAMSTREFHVEDGLVWCPLDGASWHSLSPFDVETDDDGAATQDIEDEDIDIEDEDIDGEDEEEEETAPVVKALRYRAARADAKVGTIRRKIEKIFGLPEGSVALCGPDGKALYAHAKIRTLRKRWKPED